MHLDLYSEPRTGGPESEDDIDPGSPGKPFEFGAGEGLGRNAKHDEEIRRLVCLPRSE
jgi:hypothetical protein